MCQHRPRSRTLMPPRTRMLVPGGCNLLPARHSNVESAAEQPPAAGAGVWRHAPLRPYILLHFICTILLNKKYAEYAEYAETQKSSTEPRFHGASASASSAPPAYPCTHRLLGAARWEELCKCNSPTCSIVAGIYVPTMVDVCKGAWSPTIKLASRSLPPEQA